MNNIEITCSLCNKNYSSKTSLCNHKRIYHGIKKHGMEKHYYCKHCNNEYATIQSRWVHEKRCASLTEQDRLKKEMEILKANYEKLRKEKEQKSEEIIKLQKKLLNSKRLDNKTFKAVNKILMDRSYLNMNNQNSNNTNTIHNHNNFNLISLGNEDILKVLTLQQKKEIMRSRLGSLEKIVEITHCGNYNQFKNIIITNLKDNYAYRYDDTKGYFITVPKDILLDDLITHRVTDIEEIYDELQSANKIDDRTKSLIQKFLDQMSSEDVPFFDYETKYNNFKSYKIDKIKILLYNNQDKITKDIALLISNDDDDDNDNDDNDNDDDENM